MTEPDSFVATVALVLEDQFPDGLPPPPPWLPSEVIAELQPASAVLVRMCAAVMDESPMPPGRFELFQVRWHLVFLRIGLETWDWERIDWNLNALLGTNGRGWLAKRLRSLGLSLDDLKLELAAIASDLMMSLVRRAPRKPRAYVWQVFRGRLEARIDELVAEREQERRELPVAEMPEGGINDDPLGLTMIRQFLEDVEAEDGQQCRTYVEARVADLSRPAAAARAGITVQKAEALEKKLRRRSKP